MRGNNDPFSSFEEIMEDINNKQKRGVDTLESEEAVSLEDEEATFTIEWDDDDAPDKVSGVHLKKDGTMETFGNYTPDEATKVLFETIGHHHPFRLFVQKIEGISSDCRLILVKSDILSEGEIEAIGRYIAQRIPEITVLFVPDGVTIEGLNEEALNMAGWQRIPEIDSPPDKPIPN